MKSLLVFFFFFVSLSVFGQITPNPRGFTMIDLGETQAVDVVEVNDGYITSVTSSVHNINSVTYLLKFDFDLNFVDSVELPYRYSYVTESPSLKIIGDSLYVHYYYYTPGVHIFYDDLMTFDFDLNHGNTYPLPTDSIGLTFMLTQKTDTTFIAAGSRLGTWDYMSVIEFDLTGNIINRVNFDDTAYLPYAFAISIVNLNDNRVLVTTATDTYILNLQTNIVDTVYGQVHVSEINSNRYIDIAHPFSFKKYGILGGTPQTPMVLTEIEDDGAFGHPFLLDTNRLFQFNSDSTYGFGLVRGLDADLDGNIYAISRFNKRTRVGWSGDRDSAFGSILVHKFGYVNKEVIWSKELNIYERPGPMGRPPSAASIHATSDGGCVGVFFSHSVDSILIPNGPAGFIFKLGPNGEVLAQQSFAAPKPNIFIYPNPAHEQITIESAKTLVALSVSDMSGRSVYEHSVYQNTHELDVQQWPAGVYVIRMQDKNGNVWTEKVVVE